MKHTTLQGVEALLKGARVHGKIIDSFGIYGRWALLRFALDHGKVFNHFRLLKKGVFADKVGIRNEDRAKRGKLHERGINFGLRIVQGCVINLNHFSC
jgi:hypothetical protein